MTHNDSGRHAAPDISPAAERARGRRLLRWRGRDGAAQPPMFHEQPDPEQSVELVPGSLLGYFHYGAAFEVTYGSSQNLWLKSSHHNGRFAQFGDFAPIRYEQFGQIDWRNGRTCFNYGGPKMEPDFMPLHSPAEAVVIHHALLLYWHLTRGWAVGPGDRVYPNPRPEWLGSEGAPAPVLRD